MNSCPNSKKCDKKPWFRRRIEISFLNLQTENQKSTSPESPYPVFFFTLRVRSAN